MRHPASATPAKNAMKIAFLAGAGVDALRQAPRTSYKIAPCTCGTESDRTTQERDNRDARHSRRGASTPSGERHSSDQRLLPGLGSAPRAAAVPRYGAVYTFFLDGLAPAGGQPQELRSARPRRRPSSATSSTTPRPGQGLLNYFLRGIACGAVTEAGGARDQACPSSEIRSKPFVKIMAARRAEAT